MTAWDQLAALAEAELDLARAGRWEELPAAMELRAARAAALGDAPPSARPALARLAAAHGELVALLAGARAQTAASLAHLRQGRAAVRGYGPASDAGRALGAA